MVAGEAERRRMEPAVADDLAAALGETEALPRRQLARVVRVLGEDRARALLAEARAIEAAGGQLVPDGSRRRTPGGVFFVLVRRAASPAERQAIFLHGALAPGGGQPPRATPVFTWDDFAALGPTLRQGAGEATTVKLTVIGRPGPVTQRGDVVIVPLVS